MSAGHQPTEPENQIDQSGAIEKPKKAFLLTDEMRRQITESEKEHRRYKRREKRFEFSWISCFCDELPNVEVHRPALAERRNARQEMAYSLFLASGFCFAWFVLLRLKILVPVLT